MKNTVDDSFSNRFEHSRVNHEKAHTQRLDANRTGGRASFSWRACRHRRLQIFDLPTRCACFKGRYRAIPP